MITRRFGKRPLFVLRADGSDQYAAVHLPPQNKDEEVGLCIGRIRKEYSGDGWFVETLALPDYDAIPTLRFDTKEDCAAFAVEVYMQVKHARNSSPIPDDIRRFLSEAIRELHEEEKALRTRNLSFVMRAKMLRRLAEAHGLGEIHRVQSDPDTIVREIAEWKRQGDEYPFFSEATLYELVGKEDARTLLVFIRQLAGLVDPLAAEEL